MLKWLRTIFIFMAVALITGPLLNIAMGQHPNAVRNRVYLFAAVCIALTAGILFLEWLFLRMKPRNSFIVFLGICLGLITGHFAAQASARLFVKLVDPVRSAQSGGYLHLSFVFLIMTGFAFLGAAVMSGVAWDFHFGRKMYGDKVAILDTYVIIDGRVADIAVTGFLAEKLVIPRFVLSELQYIADSGELIKRVRGRRGIEVLNRIQKLPDPQVEIIDTDFPEIREVDSKLIRLAKVTGYSLCTNDFNLDRLAELEGIQVLNLNHLANALKPVVLPGEELKVKMVKEGKEPGQGLAYLDDGTMIVVENGRGQVGRDIDIEVTTIHQTKAGRMIFAKLK